MPTKPDPQINQLAADLGALKTNLERADKVAEKLDAKSEKLQETIHSLAREFSEMRGSLRTVKTIFLPVLGVSLSVTMGLMIYLFTQNSNHVERIAKIESGVAEIQKSLTAINEILRPESLKRISMAGKDQLKEALPEVKKLISQVRDKKSQPSQESVNAIGERLIEVAKDKTDTEAAKTSWEYAVELASYRTTLEASTLSKSDPRSHNPNELFMGGNAIKFEIKDQGVTLAGNLYEDGSFTNCLISIKNENIVFKKVRFINCAFALQQNPATEKLLLAMFQETTGNISTS